MYFFDPEQLRNRISVLSRQQLATLGLWQLERLIPNFVQFSRETGWQGMTLLKLAVASGWSFLEHNSQGEIFVSESSLGAISPDTEDFTSRYTSAALDAVTAAACYIRYLRGGEQEDIVEMMSLAVDSADIFIQNTDIEIDVDDISAHPIMQQELECQSSDVELLLSSKSEAEGLNIALQRALDNLYGTKWL